MLELGEQVGAGGELLAVGHLLRFGRAFTAQEGDFVAESCERVGQRRAGLAGADVGDEADFIEGFACRSGGDEDFHGWGNDSERKTVDGERWATE